MNSSHDVLNATELVCPGLTTHVHKFCSMKNVDFIVIVVASEQADKAIRKLTIMAESYNWELHGGQLFDANSVVFSIGKTDVGKGILNGSIASDN